MHDMSRFLYKGSVRFGPVIVPVNPQSTVTGDITYFSKYLLMFPKTAWSCRVLYDALYNVENIMPCVQWYNMEHLEFKNKCSTFNTKAF